MDNIFVLIVEELLMIGVNANDIFIAKQLDEKFHMPYNPL
jgi:hypothetical protein